MTHRMFSRPFKSRREKEPIPGLAARTYKQGGSTSHRDTGEEAEISSGYGVGTGNKNTVSLQHKLIRRRTETARAERKVLRDTPTSGYYVGSWIEGRKMYFDPSKHIEDRDEAVKLARQKKQLAIYNFKTGESENV